MAAVTRTDVIKTINAMRQCDCIYCSFYSYSDLILIVLIAVVTITVTLAHYINCFNYSCSIYSGH
jgi:hypothetical protein